MNYNSDLSFIFYAPTKVIFGRNSISEIPFEMEKLGMKKSLIVSDNFLQEKTPIVDRVKKILGDNCVATFTDVPPDSSVLSVEKGAKIGREIDADSVISVGGGSVIDTAKGIAILLKFGGTLKDYEGFQNLSSKVVPHISVPTTSGTGSEVTYAAVIKDEERCVKLIFCDYNILPDVALLDPELIVGLPPFLTAATGMDAFCHAIEALHSSQREPISDALSYHAIKLLKESISGSLENPKNIEMRGMQLLASNMAGMAFSNAQVGLPHAMAHTTGAKYKLHHGHLCAIFLPPSIRYNSDIAGEIYREAGISFGLKIKNLSPLEASYKFAEEIENWTKAIGLENKLKNLGIKEDDLPSLAEKTLFDGSIVYNPKPILDVEEILKVYKDAFQ